MVEKIVELTGTATGSIEEAVEKAVSRASVTISGIREVTLTRATALVEGGKVKGWKVEVRLTFEIKDQVHE